MTVVLHPFFAWCNETALAVAIRESAWLFPWIMVAHLLSLAAFGGAVLLVDLRLMGVGLRALSPHSLQSAVRPLFAGSLVALLVSGALLFVSEALRCYETPPFWLKMFFLVVALGFTLTLRERVIRASDGPAANLWRERLAGATSMALWTGVALMGRAIGFW